MTVMVTTDKDDDDCDHDKDDDVTAMMFSAKDRDNDRANFHCAQLYVGGWWHNECYIFCPTCAVPRYFGLVGSPVIQKTRMMMKIAD